MASKARPWLIVAARIGHAAKGVVYVLVGALSAAAALGQRGRPADSEDAVAALLGASAGPVLVGLVAVGLFAYAVWELIRAATDPDRAGSDVKGIVTRLGAVVTGVIYAGFAFAAVTIAMNGPRSSGDAQARDLTAAVMAEPLGRWVIGVAGVVMILRGLWQVRRGWLGHVGEHLHLARLPASARRAILRFGSIGLAAQGIVLGIVGVFLLVATVRFDPSQARGVGGALAAVLRQPYGPWLLGAIALGLICYGAFELVRAWYRRFRVD